MFFDITAGVLQRDTLAPFIFIICLDYVLRKAIDEKTDLGFTLIQGKSRRHPAKKISDADYADDIAVLTDYLEDTAKVLHNIEQLAQVIGLYVNSEKTSMVENLKKLTTLNIWAATLAPLNKTATSVLRKPGQL